ncbi:MAG TPA: hypothetical protein V6C81_11570 [Planktothrix sp.]|jgi:ABC-type transport system involved in multi-copper enzyme maturation permease subunit
MAEKLNPGRKPKTMAIFLVFVLLGALIGSIWKKEAKAAVIGAAFGICAYAVALIGFLLILGYACRSGC